MLAPLHFRTVAWGSLGSTRVAQTPSVSGFVRSQRKTLLGLNCGETGTYSGPASAAQPDKDVRDAHRAYT